MTVVPSGNAEVAPHSAGVGVEGLEDVGVGDVILPRLQIVHADALFRDNLSKVEYSELDCIVLGLIKQRIMWADDTEDKDKPLCKSPDFTHGFPNVRDDTPKDKQFPWANSNFRPEDFPPGSGISVNNLVTLPCDSCVFKEWDKNGWKIPPCTEQHTFAVLYNTTPGGGDPTWTAALITFQKTGIKPSKQYMSSFVQSSQPMFTVRTKLTLTPASRGTVKYGIPLFRRGDPTDADMWATYAEQYRSIREFVRQPPRSQDDDEDFTAAPDANVNAAPNPAAATPAPATPPAAQPVAPQPPQAAPPATPAAAAPGAPVPDDDLPF